MRLANLEFAAAAGEGHAGLETLADLLGLACFLELRQGAFADGKHRLPVGGLVVADAELERLPVGQVHAAGVEVRDGFPCLVSGEDEHRRKHLGEALNQAVKGGLRRAATRRVGRRSVEAIFHGVVVNGGKFHGNELRDALVGDVKFAFVERRADVAVERCEGV